MPNEYMNNFPNCPISLSWRLAH